MEKPLLPMMAPIKPDDAIFHERQQNSQNTRSLFELGLFVVPLLLVFGISAAYNYFSRVPFDSARWKSPQQDTRREQMSDDLVKSKRLLGLNRAQVVALLGKPDNYYDASYLVDGSDMGYLIRYELTSPIMLVLDFDKNKRVRNVQIRTFPSPSN